ncbi:hypothetical protein [Hymenobacter algoricola]|uniref:START domain-containing protein n=1 Tax=Hymenobacter algoricola TaxID=486267 RepID=A0ABP7ME76_9BACT
MVPGSLQAVPPAYWRLETDKDGIQVYSRSLTGSRFKEIKVRCEIPGTLAQLVALYSDVDNYRAVISNTKSSRLLRRVSETEFYYYLESQMPTPVTNRDIVMRLQFEYNPYANSLIINTTSVDGLVPLKAGLVRVPSWTGQWYVRALNANRLQIDYSFRVDPGGELPAWLVNMLAPVAPYQSLIKLRNGLQLPRYQGRSFAFLNAR